MFSSKSEKLRTQKIEQLDLDQKNGGIDILDTMINEWKAEDKESVIENLEKISSTSDLLAMYVENQVQSLSWKLVSGKFEDPIAIQLSEAGNTEEELNAMLKQIAKHMHLNETTNISLSDLNKLFEKATDLALFLIKNTPFIESNASENLFYFKHSLCRKYFSANMLCDDVRHLNNSR